MYSKDQVLFLFSGQGGQYEKMGLPLWNLSESFRSIIEELSLDFEKHFDSSLYDYLFGDKSEKILTVEYSAPLIYSLQVALVKYLKYSGINPTVVCGSSMGEYAAAYCCGIFNYETGLKALKLRNKLIDEKVKGDMLFVIADKEAATKYLDDSNTIALTNSPRSTIISDSKENLILLSSKLKKEKIRSFLLNCSVPFHSPLMSPIINEYKSYLDQLSYLESTEAIFYSSILNSTLNSISSDYWIRNTLEPVNLLDSFKNIENHFSPSKIVELSGNNGLVTFYSDSNIDVDEDRTFFFFKKDEAKLQSIAKVLPNKEI